MSIRRVSGRPGAFIDCKEEEKQNLNKFNRFIDVANHCFFRMDPEDLSFKSEILSIEVLHRVKELYINGAGSLYEL